MPAPCRIPFFTSPAHRKPSRGAHQHWHAPISRVARPERSVASSFGAVFGDTSRCCGRLTCCCHDTRNTKVPERCGAWYLLRA
eukprot:6732970-Pyramimonas_sp.AAC.1